MTDIPEDTRTTSVGTVVRAVLPAADRPSPPQVKRPRENRLRALDGLRLIAALMVAAYHYGGRGGEVTQAWGTSAKAQFPTLHSWFAYGCLGVQVFFVISGFVI
ncbi:acyltransferase, partial [Arthrobacter sp. TS-15]